MPVAYAVGVIFAWWRWDILTNFYKDRQLLTNDTPWFQMFLCLCHSVQVFSFKQVTFFWKSYISRLVEIKIILGHHREQWVRGEPAVCRADCTVSTISVLICDVTAFCQLYNVQHDLLSLRKVQRNITTKTGIAIMHSTNEDFLLKILLYATLYCIVEIDR